MRYILFHLQEPAGIGVSVPDPANTWFWPGFSRVLCNKFFRVIVWQIFGRLKNHVTLFFPIIPAGIPGQNRVIQKLIPIGYCSFCSLQFHLPTQYFTISFFRVRAFDEFYKIHAHHMFQTWYLKTASYVPNMIFKDCIICSKHDI